MKKSNYLFDKSKENLEAAQILIDKAYLSSSIHCSYYSCIQFMLHILRSDLKKSEDEISKESKKGSIDSHGFHNWIQNYIFLELANRGKNARIALDFNNLLGSLKKIRVQSDYGIDEINQYVASKAFEDAMKINKIIEENFII
jgi:hypothetical protein